MDCSETDKAHGPKMHGAGRFAVAAAEAPVRAVACVGLAVLDFIFGIDVRPDRGRKAFADSMTVIGGGPAATAAAAVARLDGNASFIGQLGNDAVGDLIIGDFARWGVDTSRVRRHPSASSPVSTITVEADGERTIINHTDPRLLESANQVTKDDLSGSDAVLGDLLWPSGALSAMEAARELGIPAVLDFDHVRPGPIDAALSTPTHIVFSAPALAEVSGEGDPASALQSIAARTDAWLAVTLGDAGLVWLDDGGAAHACPAFAVEVADTLGAGDVFHGAFALGLAEHRPIEDVIRRASAASALKCTRFGGRAGIPTAEEVDEFLRQRS
ncbi:MAG: PfkB family carbohydrate kinase [Acidimicrobiia bacterium]